MSVQLYSASGSGGKEASIQGTTVGGSKPLHRFIKGQPKIVGIIVLILGVSSFIITVAMNASLSIDHIWTGIPLGFMVGSLFIISGILFILTEHNPTKKIVTASLALSIVTILVTFWTAWHLIVHLEPNHHNRHYDYSEDNTTENAVWQSYSEAMELSLEMIFTFYNLVGIIIFIVMSCFAGAALRSTKSQAVVVMTTAPPETPAE
ncbi:membrane-spanning 4-domains subfamily A member 4D-like [Anabas testudineus]|uniref:Uncharacterized protein n=1 Tax=Anabas testudineus TaxID=64144 RepID=A0A3Q1J5B1_ANATE|nr:membrane-spanning 4-domains subfamily A member 4D-like [Anabas testudineus]